jgi:tetratricopeptide (TPR) repeat protein
VADPEVQKVLDGLKKVDEAIDKAKKARDQDPSDWKGAIRALEEAVRAKRKVIESIPSVLGINFFDLHDDLEWMDRHLEEAIRLLATGGKDEESVDHVKAAETLKHQLEKLLKEADEKKDSGK